MYQSSEVTKKIIDDLVEGLEQGDPPFSGRDNLTVYRLLVDNEKGKRTDRNKNTVDVYIAYKGRRALGEDIQDAGSSMNAPRTRLVLLRVSIHFPIPTMKKNDDTLTIADNLYMFLDDFREYVSSLENSVTYSSYRLESEMLEAERSGYLQVEQLWTLSITE